MSRTQRALALATGGAPKMQCRDRSAFGYFDPSGTKYDNFAQCSTCEMWIAHPGRCLWLDEDFKVEGRDSCIMYVPGNPIYEEMTPQRAFDPEEVGFYRGEVRCENCVSSDGKGHCNFFRELNTDLPRLFDLDVNIDAKGCCNAFHPAE